MQTILASMVILTKAPLSQIIKVLVILHILQILCHTLITLSSSTLTQSKFKPSKINKEALPIQVFIPWRVLNEFWEFGSTASNWPRGLLCTYRWGYRYVILIFMFVQYSFCIPHFASHPYLTRRGLLHACRQWHGSPTPCFPPLPLCPLFTGTCT